MPGQQVIEKGRARIPQVQLTRGTWRKPRRLWLTERPGRRNVHSAHGVMLRDPRASALGRIESITNGGSMRIPPLNRIRNRLPSVLLVLAGLLVHSAASAAD